MSNVAIVCLDLLFDNRDKDEVWKIISGFMLDFMRKIVYFYMNVLESYSWFGFWVLFSIYIFARLNSCFVDLLMFVWFSGFKQKLYVLFFNGMGISLV